jgi:hypothetical protein
MSLGGRIFIVWRVTLMSPSRCPPRLHCKVVRLLHYGCVPDWLGLGKGVGHGPISLIGCWRADGQPTRTMYQD